jgi:hypothetical protein
MASQQQKPKPAPRPTPPADAPTTNKDIARKWFT